jgi:hypothetical protein
MKVPSSECILFEYAWEIAIDVNTRQASRVKDKHKILCDCNIFWISTIFRFQLLVEKIEFVAPNWKIDVKREDRTFSW